jgi:eukaryotic-like serine/threonine-protein kinase
MTEKTSDIGVRIGDIVAGKYCVEEVLGAGGMGVVVAARHLALHEKVALKFLRPRALEIPEAVPRFLREARAAAKIKNEHVARVSDVGQLDDGMPYMVMEHLEGCDLATLLEQQGPLPVAQCVDFLLQAGEAIAEAHVFGIVHRDLKPANLFCVRRGDGGRSIKVLDFGISKVTREIDRAQDITTTAEMIGSPLYMSPEQLQSSKDVDARTDIWSLGVIVFQLLTARPPFFGRTVTELVYKVATSPPASLRTYRPDLPVRLEEIVARCLEKDRRRRFSTIGELAVALKEFGSKGAEASVERILGTLRGGAPTEVSLVDLSGELVPTLEPTRCAPAPTPHFDTRAEWSGTHRGIGRRGGRSLAWVGVSVVAIVAVGAVVALRYGAMATVTTASSALHSSEPASGSASGSAAPSVVTPPPTEATAIAMPAGAPPTLSVPEAAARASVAMPPTTTRTSTEPRPSHTLAGPRPPRSASTLTSPHATTAPKTPPDCDPNYTLDAEGRKHFKHQCFP